MSTISDLEARIEALENAADESLTPPGAYTISPGGLVSSIYLVQSETPFIPVGPSVTAETINAAIASLPGNGGTIILPPGDFTLDQPVNADNTLNVTILGTGSSYGGTRLKSGGAFDLVTARSSGGFRLQSLALWNSNNAYSGQLLNLSSLPSGGLQETGLFRIDDCNFTGQPGASGYGINIKNALSGNISGSYFINGGTGIRGLFVPGDFCNANQIDNCFFQGQSAVSISNLGDGCGVQGCTFEPLGSGAPGAYFQDVNLPCASLSWLNNWTGDATTGGTWMVVNGVAILITASIFSGGTDGILTNGNCSGLAVIGNAFGFASGITHSLDTSTGSHDHVIYLGNSEVAVTSPLPTTANWGNGSIMNDTVFRSTNDLVATFGDTTQVRIGNKGGAAPVIFFGQSEDVEIHRASAGVLATSNNLALGGTLQYTNPANIATSASAGTHGAPPAQVAGYLIAADNLGGIIKIPYYSL